MKEPVRVQEGIPLERGKQPGDFSGAGTEVLVNCQGDRDKDRKE